LFSTAALAYAALRQAVERESAINLLMIDDAARQHNDDN
jgi:signal recognition particle GTPase